MTRQKKVFIFNDAELTFPPLIRSVRSYASSLSIPSHHWHDFLVDLHRDLSVDFCDALGRIVDVDLSVYEFTDDQIDSGEATRLEERISEWFAYVCAPIPVHVTPYVLPQTKERFRTLASLLVAAYEQETANWPRLTPVNDNWLRPTAANDNERLAGDEAEKL